LTRTEEEFCSSTWLLHKAVSEKLAARLRR
jgi:hypothetical protein